MKVSEGFYSIDSHLLQKLQEETRHSFHMVRVASLPLLVLTELRE